jgi:hypothetical protein
MGHQERSAIRNSVVCSLTSDLRSMTSDPRLAVSPCPRVVDIRTMLSPMSPESCLSNLLAIERHDQGLPGVY